MDVRQCLAEGRKRLAGQPAARLEAEVLLCQALGIGRAWLYANPEAVPDAVQAENYMDLIARRESGEPIAYLAGVREFWSLPIKVTPDVLIPRAETEMLVETALEFIPREAAWRIADLGTGSGAVALALAVERPECMVHAVDCSSAALEVARENARNIAPGRIRFHAGEWLAPLEGQFQLLVSNPPYVAEDDPHLRRGDCRFEPAAALTPGKDAMASIRHIVGESPRYLGKGGMLAFEHGFDQADAARQLMVDRGFSEVATRDDLEKRPRVTSGVWE